MPALPLHAMVRVPCPGIEVAGFLVAGNISAMLLVLPKDFTRKVFGASANDDKKY